MLNLGELFKAFHRYGGRLLWKIVIGKIRISEGQMMKKKVLVFYGLNLLITVFFALLFGGILGSIGGNELMLGLFIVSGVQLSPLVTTVIVRKIYKTKKGVYIRIQ